MNISEANAVVTLLAAAGLRADNGLLEPPAPELVDEAARFLAERAGHALQLTVRVSTTTALTRPQ